MHLTARLRALRERTSRPPKSRPLYWRLLVPVVFGAAGMLFVTSAATAKGTDLRAGRSDLGDLIRRQQHALQEQSRQLTALQQEVLRETASEASRDGRVAGAQAAADALAGPAGLQEVTGPGITVALDDAPRPADGQTPTGVPPDYLVVHQQDVQAVVNALWAGGAEALQLMDQRVISTSAVRCVGNTLILQGVVYSPPFVITAIGDPDALKKALDDSPTVQIYKQYVDAYDLGYTVKTPSSIVIPAYQGSLGLKLAQVPSP